MRSTLTRESSFGCAMPSSLGRAHPKGYATRSQFLRSAGTPVRGDTRQEQPGRHDRVRIQGQAVDALLDQPARQVRMVGGTLAADTDVFALPATGADRHRD